MQEPVNATPLPVEQAGEEPKANDAQEQEQGPIARALQPLREHEGVWFSKTQARLAPSRRYT